MVRPPWCWLAPRRPLHEARIKIEAVGNIFFDISNSKLTITTAASPGITVNPASGLVVTEGAGTASFDVVLNNPPTADVSFGLIGSNTAEGLVSLASLTFTPANWNVPQAVTVTGVDDAVVDGNVGYAILTTPATSANTSSQRPQSSRCVGQQQRQRQRGGQPFAAISQ